MRTWKVYEVYREMQRIQEPTRIDRVNDMRKYDADEADIQQAETKCIIVYMAEHQLIFTHPNL